MVSRRVWGWRRLIRSKTWNTKAPTRADSRKKEIIRTTTSTGEVVGSWKLVMTVSTRMPSTSSIMAADRIVVPTRVFSRPSSRSAWTVMETEVAVRMQPINRALWKLGS